MSETFFPFCHASKRSEPPTGETFRGLEVLQVGPDCKERDVLCRALNIAFSNGCASVAIMSNFGIAGLTLVVGAGG